MTARHHPMFVREFGDTALVIRDGNKGVAAYLFGFISPTRVGYVHLIGVRADSRRAGLGRTQYREFETLARQRGATSLKAISNPTNHRVDSLPSLTRHVRHRSPRLLGPRAASHRVFTRPHRMLNEWSDPERVADYLKRETPHRDIAEGMLLEALPDRVEHVLRPRDRRRSNAGARALPRIRTLTASASTAPSRCLHAPASASRQDPGVELKVHDLLEQPTRRHQPV